MTTRADGTKRRTLWFTGLLLASCLLLQRFGVPFGDKQLSIVGPVGVALAAWGLASGVLALHRARLVLFLLLVTVVLIGLGYHAALPSGLGDGSNVRSLAQFLLLTAFATLTFTERLEERVFFRLVTSILLVVALAGIGQFAVQFVGLRLFSFTGLLPDSLLFELGYNLEIPVGIGEILKSNGLVLVEPSVFSQMMAVGLMLEAVAFRRPAFLVAFAAGLLLSFSGTGWIVLAAFVVGSAVASGRRGLLTAGGVVLLLGLVLLVVSVAAPDFAAALIGRLDEVGHPGTSGHLRFVTPFWMLDDVMNADPVAFLLGIGSGGSERLPLPYEYDVNTPVKIMAEYGAPALLAYVMLFVVGRKTPMQRAVVFPAVVLFMATGGYQQFPPMVFLILLLTSVARLREDQPRVARSAGVATPRSVLGAAAAR